MTSRFDAPPPGVIDRRDGNTKGECGITSVNCLFCKDQISSSAGYVKQFDKMQWASKGDCHMATCPFWGSPECWQKYARIKNPKAACPIYKNWERTRKWDVERSELD